MTAVRGSARRRRGRSTGGARPDAWRALIVLAATALIVLGLGLWSGDRLPAAVSQRIYPLHYKQVIVEAAQSNGVDPYLVAAVVKAESNFDPQAVSRGGAVGLMQLMPDTARWIVQQADWSGATDPDLNDPEHNVALGTYYLAYLLRVFHDDEAAALAAYNAGQGVVAEWLERAVAADSGEESPTLRSEDIPFPETRKFVARVERFRTIYSQAHPGLAS